jgi:hypothetical protein
MEDQRLKEHAQYVELRCLESGRYKPHNTMRIENGLGILLLKISSPFSLPKKIEAISTVTYWAV